MILSPNSRHGNIIRCEAAMPNTVKLCAVHHRPVNIRMFRILGVIGRGLGRDQGKLCIVDLAPLNFLESGILISRWAMTCCTYDGTTVASSWQHSNGNPKANPCYDNSKNSTNSYSYRGLALLYRPRRSNWVHLLNINGRGLLPKNSSSVRNPVRSYAAKTVKKMDCDSIQ